MFGVRTILVLSSGALARIGDVVLVSDLMSMCVCMFGNLHSLGMRRRNLWMILVDVLGSMIYSRMLRSMLCPGADILERVTFVFDATRPSLLGCISVHVLFELWRLTLLLNS